MFVLGLKISLELWLRVELGLGLVWYPGHGNFRGRVIIRVWVRLVLGL